MLWLLLFMIMCPSFAEAGSIIRSKHDLGFFADVSHASILNNYNAETCVYCHTPHNADQSQGPLWNRLNPLEQGVSYELYSSPSMDASSNQPGVASLICLSCHDGTMALDVIINPPNTGVTITADHANMTILGTDPVDCGVECHPPGYGLHTPSYFETDLSNQHPIGIEYSSDPELQPLPPDGKFANGIKVVSGKVECTSCHNVHDPEIDPFLWTSNSSSSICYTCHIK